MRRRSTGFAALAWPAASIAVVAASVVLDMVGMADAGRVAEGVAVIVVAHLTVARRMALLFVAAQPDISPKQALARAVKGWAAASAVGILVAAAVGLLSGSPTVEGLMLQGALAASLAHSPVWWAKGRRLATDSATRAYAVRAAMAHGDPSVVTRLPAADWSRLRQSGLDPEAVGSLMAKGSTTEQILAGRAEGTPPAIADGFL